MANALLNGVPRAISNPIWDYLSSLYAEGLTGEVTVFQGEMSVARYEASILINTELPIVISNVGRTVTNIIWAAVP